MYSPPRWLQASQTQSQIIGIGAQFGNPVRIVAKSYPSSIIVQNSTDYVLFFSDSSRRIIFRAPPRQTVSYIATNDVLVWFSSVPCSPYLRNPTAPPNAGDAITGGASASQFAVDYAQIFLLPELFFLPVVNSSVTASLSQIIKGPHAPQNLYFTADTNTNNPRSALPAGITSMRYFADVNVAIAADRPYFVAWHYLNITPSDLAADNAGWGAPNEAWYENWTFDQIAQLSYQFLQLPQGVSNGTLEPFVSATAMSLNAGALASGDQFLITLVLEFPVLEWPFIR